MTSPLLIFAATSLLAGTLGVAAQATKIHRVPGACPQSLSWMLKYAAPNNKSDRDNEKLVTLPCFKKALEKAFGSASSFLGKEDSVAETALASISASGNGLTSEGSRYITVTGCVPHQCPSRGMVWIDTLGGGQIIFVVSRPIPTKRTTDSEICHLWLYSSSPIPDDLVFPEPFLNNIKAVFGSENLLSVTLVPPHGEMLAASPSALNIHSVQAPISK